MMYIVYVDFDIIYIIMKVNLIPNVFWQILYLLHIVIYLFSVPVLFLFFVSILLSMHDIYDIRVIYMLRLLFIK